MGLREGGNNKGPTARTSNHPAHLLDPTLELPLPLEASLQLFTGSKVPLQGLDALMALQHLSVRGVGRELTNPLTCNPPYTPLHTHTHHNHHDTHAPLD